LTTSEKDESETLRRASVWSVSEGWLTAYFLLFTIQFIAGASVVIWYEMAVVTHDSPADTLMSILWRAGVIPILSASNSYILSEGGRLTMVISNWVERKLEERRIKREQALIEMGRKEGRVEGRAEGRAEGRVEGRAEGRAEGRVEGRAEGFEQGRAYERKRFPNGAAVDGSDERQKADED
jgi:hypothetical protein